MNASKGEIQAGNAPIKQRVFALLITIGLTGLICWGVIFSGNLSGRGAYDDLLYHWVAVNQFAQQWPSPDLGDYASATTPGYHLLLAPLVHAGLDHTGAQLVASAWTLALMGLLCWIVSRSWGLASAALMLPMIASLYVIFPGIWLLPDNAGWFFVLSVLLLALRSRAGWGVWAISGLLLVALVWMRQVHIWAAAPIWLTAWLGSSEMTPHSLRSFFGDPLKRAGRTIIAQGCTIPAFVMLVWFLVTWGGLVPPTFQDMHQGPNPATPGFMLMQLAILSAFFAPLLLPRLIKIWTQHWRLVLFAAIAGLLLGVLPSSSYSEADGRFGGWWNILGKLPTIADRSPFFVLGSIGGSIALALWLSLASRRDIWIWLGVLVAFSLAQSANHASWQRYHEPLLLMMIVLIIARSGELDRVRIRAVIGSAVLAMMLGAITINSMRNAKPIEQSMSKPPMSAKFAQTGLE